jgi:hypothetical protein
MFNMANRPPHHIEGTYTKILCTIYFKLLFMLMKLFSNVYGEVLEA